MGVVKSDGFEPPEYKRVCDWLAALQATREKKRSHTVADNDRGLSCNGLLRDPEGQIVSDENRVSLRLAWSVDVIQEQSYVVPSPICQFLGVPITRLDGT